ncbi:PAAR domain-containing protein [Metapseudomonas otitidis]|uniref:PAAR domain-containing protein n=1 Tax=Metapseudomonas otitidis TaxID=319939 RepID=UPI00260DAF23|nr:PAAR domain-containing protein [Pseudomonas otitidis]
MSGKPAARLSDPTACPIPFHLINPIAVGSPDVLFDGLPAARQGDPSACGGAMVANVIPNVLINGKPAATVGTVGSHGNVVIAGSGTVLIGTSHSPATFTPPSHSNLEGFHCICLLHDCSGQGVPNLSYSFVAADGAEQVGVTCAEGKTSVVSTGQSAEVLTLYIWG